MTDYLFSSRKGQNEPITRIQAYRLLNTIAEKIGLDEIGTHTLRKSFRLSLLQKNEGHCYVAKII